MAQISLISINSVGGVFLDPATLQIFLDAAACVLPTEQTQAGPMQDACSSADETGFVQATGRPRLSRLTLHISNSCNLACAYCYASGGDYGMGRKMMKSDDAIDLLSQAFDTFDIETLMFFGGEPSLNVGAITDCCVFVRELYERKLIRNMPRFGTISNLAGSTDNFDLFLAVCKTFDFSITVSIDGQPEIHDANRPTVKGKGSFEHVKRNYFRAKKLGIPLDIQCTYSSQHVEAGISVLDLMRFFKSEFGVSHTHIAPASCSPIGDFQPTQQAIIQSYCEAIQYMVGTLNTAEHLSIDIGQRLIKSLINRQNISHYCPAGNSELTIGPDGQLSPCFMFVGNKSFDMGKIENGERWLSAKGEAILEAIRENGKDRHPVCRQCWAKNLCSGCIGGDYLETHSLSVKPQCAFVMSTIAETVVRLAEAVQGLPMGIYGNEQRERYLGAVRQTSMAMPQAVSVNI